jgi:hypothetical protein
MEKNESNILLSGKICDVQEYFDEKSKQYNGCKMGVQVVGLWNKKKIIYVADYTKARHSEDQQIKDVPIDVDIDKYGKVKFQVIESNGNGSGNKPAEEKKAAMKV